MINFVSGLVELMQTQLTLAMERLLTAPAWVSALATPTRPPGSSSRPALLHLTERGGSPLALQTSTAVPPTSPVRDTEPGSKYTGTARRTGLNATLFL